MTCYSTNSDILTANPRRQITHILLVKLMIKAESWITYGRLTNMCAYMGLIFLHNLTYTPSVN